MTDSSLDRTGNSGDESRPEAGAGDDETGELNYSQ